MPDMSYGETNFLINMYKALMFFCYFQGLGLKK